MGLPRLSPTTALLLLAALTAAATTPPTIITQPLTTAVFRGNNAVLTVKSTLNAPGAYQWRMDGRDLPGQTNSSLVLNQVQTTNEGDYVVVITNF